MPEKNDRQWRGRDLSAYGTRSRGMGGGGGGGIRRVVTELPEIGLDDTVFSWLSAEKELKSWDNEKVCTGLTLEF